MQFLINVIDTSAPTEQTSGTATGDEMDAIDAFNDRLRADGHWVMAAGITAPEQAITIDNRGGADLVTPGPFVRADEHVAGFWVVTADDLTQATALALEGSRVCNRKVELRAFL